MRTFLLMTFLTAIFMGIGYLIGGPTGSLMALLFAGITNFFSYWFSSSMVLSLYNAQPLERVEFPLLFDMVERLTERAHLPMPTLYRLPNDQPNAFATGRNPSNAALAVTDGLLKLLDKHELEGVIAHEIAHIKNGDMLIMTITATLAGAISFLAHFSLNARSNRNQMGFVGALLLFILAPLAATLVQLAISRTREYAADETGAHLTGNPLGLASALRQIDHYAQGIDNPEAEANPATAHLFIMNPLHGGSVDHLFSTHPNTDNRIQRLEQMVKHQGPWVR